MKLASLAAASLVPALLCAQAGGGVSPLVVPTPTTTLPLKHAPQPTTADITAADLMTRLYIFADDSMQGREAGTIGNVKATNYIAGEIAKIGLVPAGDGGTYFQTIPLKVRSIDKSANITVNGAPLAFGTDWVIAGGSDTAAANVPVVYAGTVGDTAKMLPASAVDGKIAVYTVVGRGVDLQGRAKGAVAVVLLGLQQYMGFFTRPSMFLDDQPAGARPATPPVIIVSQAAAAKLFETPVDALKPGDAGNNVSLHVLVHVEPAPFPARNVVGILPGSDSALKGEYVAIGAHNDHIGIQPMAVDHDSLRVFNHLVRPGGAEQTGKQATAAEQAEVNRELAAWRTGHPNTQRRDSIANGADDDGSGSVGVLEIAQKMASLTVRPRRSILFVWHVGEEKGLYGSQYFTDHPTVPRDSIVAQLNMDMIGRGDAWDVSAVTKDGQSIHGNPNYLQVVGSRRLSTELGDLVEKVDAQDKHGLQLDYSMDANGHPMNIYCRSDHYEYARYGIPIAFFTTGGHSDYHQVTDEPEYIDYVHMARVANFVEDVALHVADLDHRMVVDHPKPDPHGACRQ